MKSYGDSNSPSRHFQAKNWLCIWCCHRLNYRRAQSPVCISLTGFARQAEPSILSFSNLLLVSAKRFSSLDRPGLRQEPGGLSVTETSAGWLSRVAGISEQAASQTNATLGVKVAERVAHNAGTPRTVLGISAALLKQPEVLVYSTEALDIEGCRTVHRCVASRCSSLCVVHISYPSVFGDGTPHPRVCPPGAKCVEISESAKV